MSKLPKNFGVDIKNFKEKPQDWKFGASPLGVKEINPEADWSLFLPTNELQHFSWGDSFGCVSFSALNCLETLHKFKYSETLNRSDKYTVVSSGTTKSGNTFVKVGDSIRKLDGTVSEQEYPAQANSWDDYYSPISDSLHQKGLLWLNEYEINYEWVSPPFSEQLMQALKVAPIQITVYAWEKPKIVDGDEIYQRTDKINNHAVMLFAYEKDKYWFIFDHYDKTIKKLAWDFLIGYAFRYSIEKTLEPIKITDYMFKFIKLETASTVYAANPVNMTCKALDSEDDYFNLTDDHVWKQIETVTNDELAKYKLLGKLYCFNR